MKVYRFSSIGKLLTDWLLQDCTNAYNIKMDLMELLCDYGTCMQLVKDHVCWRASI
jgi:hypothetical protein